MIMKSNSLAELLKYKRDLKNITKDQEDDNDIY